MDAHLNARGHRRDFKVGDTVSIYMPPTADEARRRKCKAKHLDWFRGPCVITAEQARSIFVARRNIGARHLASRLAPEVGISSKAIRDIWSLRTWTHLIAFFDSGELRPVL